MIRRFAPVVLLLLVPCTLFAQEAVGDDRADRGQTGSRFPVKIETVIGISGSADSAYVSTDPSIVWKPGLFAAGIGAEMIFGASRFEIHVVPGLRLELGWLYLTGGYLLPLAPGAPDSIPEGFSLGGGVAPEPFALGYGRLGFEVSMDTSVPLFQSVMASSAAGAPLLVFLESMVFSTRAGIGITYSFML